MKVWDGKSSAMEIGERRREYERYCGEGLDVTEEEDEAFERLSEKLAEERE